MAELPFESMGQCVEYYPCSAIITVYLPRKEPFCRRCPYCEYKEPMRTYYCRITNEEIIDPFHTRGAKCPLIVDDVQPYWKGEK